MTVAAVPGYIAPDAQPADLSFAIGNLLRGASLDTFEYLSVLVSVVAGLAVVHILQGVGRLIASPAKEKLYWAHSLWVIQSLLFLFNFWWFQLGYRPVEQWSSALFLFVLIYAIALYLQCVIIMPERPQADYEEYFFSRRAWFFGILFTVFTLDFVDTYLKPEGVLPRDLPGVEALVIQWLFLAAMCGTAIYTRKRWFHGLFAVLMFASTLANLLGRPEPGS